MSQTVTQKQCTESKTGLGAQVHTQRTMAARMVCPSYAHCAPAARALCCVVAHSVPCRRPPLGRLAAVPRAPLCAMPRVSQLFPRPCRARIETQTSTQAARLSRYTHLYRDPISQQPGPRALALARGPAVSQAMLAVSWPLLWPCRGPVQPYRGRACLAMHTLCHDTFHCIVTHTRRKWAVAQPPLHLKNVQIPTVSEFDEIRRVS